MLKYILITLLLALSINPVIIFAAEEQEVEASVNLTSIVPSRVCPQYSSIESNVPEVLADKSQKVLITVTLRDCSQKPLPGLLVSLHSNRGEIDNLQTVDSTGKQVTFDREQNISITNPNGFSYFEIRSEISGKSSISATVDLQVRLPQSGSINITWLPLPFPEGITISIDVPKFLSEDGKITLFKPSKYPVNKDNLVTEGLELIIPISVLICFLGLFFIAPVLFMIIIYLLRKINKINSTEKVILEKIEKEESEIKDIISSKK